MSKNNWTQERTDRLTKTIFGWKRLCIYERRSLNHDRITWKVFDGEVDKFFFKKIGAYFLNSFYTDKKKWKVFDGGLRPATDMNHAMMLVDSKWFRERYCWEASGYDDYAFYVIRKNNAYCVCAGRAETPELAICLALEKLMEVI